jgi:hypothetical protein
MIVTAAYAGTREIEKYPGNERHMHTCAKLSIRLCLEKEMRFDLCQTPKMLRCNQRLNSKATILRVDKTEGLSTLQPRIGSQRQQPN